MTKRGLDEIKARFDAGKIKANDVEALIVEVETLWSAVKTAPVSVGPTFTSPSAALAAGLLKEWKAP